MTTTSSGETRLQSSATTRQEQVHVWNRLSHLLELLNHPFNLSSRRRMIFFAGMLALTLGGSVGEPTQVDIVNAAKLPGGIAVSNPISPDSRSDLGVSLSSAEEVADSVTFAFRGSIKGETADLPQEQAVVISPTQEIASVDDVVLPTSDQSELGVWSAQLHQLKIPPIQSQDTQVENPIVNEAPNYQVGVSPEMEQELMNIILQSSVKLPNLDAGTTEGWSPEFTDAISASNVAIIINTPTQKMGMAFGSIIRNEGKTFFVTDKHVADGISTYGSPDFLDPKKTTPLYLSIVTEKGLSFLELKCNRYMFRDLNDHSTTVRDSLSIIELVGDDSSLPINLVLSPTSIETLNDKQNPTNVELQIQGFVCLNNQESCSTIDFQTRVHQTNKSKYTIWEPHSGDGRSTPGDSGRGIITQTPEGVWKLAGTISGSGRIEYKGSSLYSNLVDSIYAQAFPDSFFLNTQGIHNTLEEPTELTSTTIEEPQPAAQISNLDDLTLSPIAQPRLDVSEISDSGFTQNASADIFDPKVVSSFQELIGGSDGEQELNRELWENATAHGGVSFSDYSIKEPFPGIDKLLQAQPPYDLELIARANNYASIEDIPEGQLVFLPPPIWSSENQQFLRLYLTYLTNFYSTMLGKPSAAMKQWLGDQPNNIPVFPYIQQADVNNSEADGYAVRPTINSEGPRDDYPYGVYFLLDEQRTPMSLKNLGHEFAHEWMGVDIENKLDQLTAEDLRRLGITNEKSLDQLIYATGMGHQIVYFVSDAIWDEILGYSYEIDGYGSFKLVKKNNSFSPNGDESSIPALKREFLNNPHLFKDMIEYVKQ